MSESKKTTKPTAAKKKAAVKPASKAKPDAIAVAPKGDEVISVNQILLGYDGRVVLDRVSLSVFDGELFGLIGLNGVGKTSLIKIMLNLRAAHDGTVAMHGIDSRDTEARQDVAYLPERFDPPLFMTGHEFIRFSAQLYGRKVSEAQAVEYAEMLGLRADYLKRRANTYSKGMRQKLGLIATVLSGCKILILDEPMSGLDPLARVMVKDLLVKCHKEGRTIFLSSHILADLDELCDRIAILHDRHFQFIGTPAGLRKEVGEQTLERAFLKKIDISAAPVAA